ncbi:MAG: glycosyltransferase family 1 protein [Chloroflexi bacterium]|nr:glycosyltransferase family 1 protein [Chloroflexota bacterium]
MKITFLAIGSRGDVQPYIGLGRGLQTAGHQVQIAAVGEFRGLVEAGGLDFFPLTGQVSDLLANPATVEAITSGRNTIKAMRNLLEMVRPVIFEMFSDAYRACQGSDLILNSTLAIVGHSIGEKLGIPAIDAIPYPLSVPTRAFPNVGWPLPTFNSGAINYLSHFAVQQIAWQIIRPVLQRVRQEQLELPPAPFLGDGPQGWRDTGPLLFGYSQHVLPRPPEWHDNIHVTGFWFYDEPAWTPPEDLVTFIEEGPSPVYIGFGSMVTDDMDRMTAMVGDALDRTDQRAVIGAGWAGLGHHLTGVQRERVFIVDAVPHAWLFPQMAAVVHHGGGGTTAAGFRAGVPTVVIPFFVDQPWWARRVEALGVGPQPIPRDELSAERLAYALRVATTHPGIRERAAQLGAAIRAEDGVEAARQVIERIGKGL